MLVCAKANLKMAFFFIKSGKKNMYWKKYILEVIKEGKYQGENVDLVNDFHGVGIR